MPLGSRFFLFVDKFLPDYTVKTVLVTVQFVWSVDFGVWSCFQLHSLRFIGFRSMKLIMYRKGTWNFEYESVVSKEFHVRF
jgi:hypothetical protein